MRWHALRSLILPVLVILVGIGVYLYLRPVPAVGPISQIVAPPKTQAIALIWPTTGQAAIGAVGYGVLDTHDTTAQVPIASIAKVIAALAVLRQNPLAVGSPGPNISIDSTDLGYFNYYYQNDGSAAKVQAGETLTEYQLLQGMLIPSANNMADSLVRWAFGSPAAYTTYANKMVKELGLTNTSVGGASGFADDTTSTAEDLVRLGLKAMNNPVIAQIVSQQSADIPVAGNIKNVNWLLGSNGVVGIKTGNTDKAGGCYLFAANRQIQGKTITIIGAVLGAPALNDAIESSVPLLAASDNGFQEVSIIKKGQVLGTFKAPWGDKSEAKAAHDVSILVWKGKDIKVLNSLDSIDTPAKAGDQAGTVEVQSTGVSSKSELIISHGIPRPSWLWRIFR